MKISDRYWIRKTKDRVMLFLIYSALLLAFIPLFSILGDVFFKGAPMFSVSLLTEPTPTAGDVGGGIANALQGTLITIGFASLIGVPIGLMSGVFLSEYSENKLTPPIRFLNDVLSGFPSIIIGVFAYTLIVLYLGFSVIAAAFALAIIMIPIVTRTTEEALKLVPATIREAAISLGIPKWKTVVTVVFSGAKKNIVTGILLSLARVAGESAPILVTMGYWRWWFAGLDKPAGNLALNIFIFGTSPFEGWKALAFASAFILILLILGISIVVRVITMERYR